MAEDITVKLDEGLFQRMNNAQRFVKLQLKNKQSNRKQVLESIAGWSKMRDAYKAQGEVGRVSAITYEFVVAFAIEMDKQYAAKYESYLREEQMED
jgi:hypothetical protein